MTFMICTSYSQQHLLMGVEITPTMAMSIQKDRATGILSSKNGMGFKAGLPLRWAISETRIINTGLNFEFMQFNQTIARSTGGASKITALNLPVSLGIQMSGNTFFMIGGGGKMNFSCKTIEENGFQNVKKSI